MKNLRNTVATTLSALFLSTWAASAAITLLDPSYSVSVHHTHNVATSSIVSFDWDGSNNLHYQTSTSSFSFGGLYRWNGSTQSTLVAGNSDFSGYSVVRIDDSIFYNTSSSQDQKIFKCGPLSGAPVTSMISTATNNSLHARGLGELFITGAPNFGTNQIYYAALDGSGNFVASPFSLGVTSGSSGPLAFDSAGNLYYAPGFGDLKIYKYSAAEVAAAISDPVNSPLPSASSRLWRDYSTDYSTVSGGTGLAFDKNGDLLATLTDFSNPSFLVRFDIDLDGDYAGFHTILRSDERLGDVRFLDGTIYLARENTVLQVIPEPTGGWLILGGLVVIMLGRYPRHRPGFNLEVNQV